MIKVEKKGDQTIVTLENGHMAALEKIVNDYSLKGEREAFDFMLSILSEADGKAINNGKGAFVPSEKLKQSNGKTE